MGVFRPVVQALVLAMLDAREYVPLGRPVARQLIGDQHARHKRKTLEQLPQEFHGCPLIAPPLDQNVEDVAVLIDRAPQVLLRAVDADEHLVQVPLVARTRASPTQRVRVGLAEFLAPLAHRFVGDDHPALGEQLLHVAIAEREAEIQPNRMADDRGREAVTSITRGRDFISHATSIARPPSPALS